MLNYEIYDILQFTRKLCTFTTGVITDDNPLLFAEMQKVLPFHLHQFKSWTSHNGWIIPENWRVEKATISRNGEVLFNGLEHPLGVAMLSTSFQGKMDFDQLKQKIVTNPEQPEAFMFHSIWQIRSWEKDWALCVPYKIYQQLTPGTYDVDLKVSLCPGEMTVAEYIHKGRSNKSIIFNANTCHPAQANDGFCAVSMLIYLFKWLQGQDTYYNYHLILAPEHLGSIYYMKDKSPEEIENIVSAIFMEMPGTDGPICATSTLLGGQDLDQIFSHTVRRTTDHFRVAGWREGCGNDETVWEAPGHEIPTVEITRSADPNFPYPEYHSSLDNADLMDEGQLDEMLSILKKVIFTAENNVTIHRHFNGLICLSNPEYDLYFERHDPTIDKGLTDEDEKWGHLLDYLFRYFDGSMTVLDIAVKHDLTFEKLLAYIKRFADKELVSLRFKPISRPPLSRPEIKNGS